MSLVSPLRPEGATSSEKGEKRFKVKDLGFVSEEET
jgi:hypothetical protein